MKNKNCKQTKVWHFTNNINLKKNENWGRTRNIHICRYFVIIFSDTFAMEIF